MSKTFQWTIGISVILIVLTMVFSTIAPYIFPNTWGGYGSGMMGRGMMGGGMMGGFGFMPFGGFMFLGPILFIGAIVLGIILLVRALAPTQTAASALCTHCGKTLQPNWKACPYCGEKV